MKSALIIILALIMSACSHNRETYEQDPLDIKSRNFAELVQLIRTNKTPIPELKNRARLLATQAGLYTKCINKDCFLTNGQHMVRIDNEWVHIEFIHERRYVKIQSVEDAIEIIYFHG